MAALTAEFGTVSGDPRLRGRAHEGRSPVVKPGRPWRPHGAHISTFPTIARTGEPPMRKGEELGLLVPLASTGRPACSCGLSTRCSAWALTGRRTHLGDGFPLRCLQRLSVPGVAMRRCRWSATAPPEARPPRSSRTRGGPPQFSCARGG